MSENIRPAAVAGTFYGADPVILKNQLAQVSLPAPAEGMVHGCMVPHAGYVYSMPTAMRTMAMAAGKKFDRIVIIGPSHRFAFTGIRGAGFDSWATPFGNMPEDPAAAAFLKANVSQHVQIDPAPHRQEHSIEVQLPLLNHLFGTLPIVPLLAGQLNLAIADEVGKLLSKLDTPGTLWVISGDFTHYGRSFSYTPFGLPVDPEKLNALDREGADFIADKDISGLASFLSRTHATICGVNPAALYIMMMKYSNRKSAGRVLEITDSSRSSGDCNHVVGYAGIVFAEI